MSQFLNSSGIDAVIQHHKENIKSPLHYIYFSFNFTIKVQLVFVYFNYMVLRVFSFIFFPEIVSVCKTCPLRDSLDLVTQVHTEVCFIIVFFRTFAGVSLLFLLGAAIYFENSRTANRSRYANCEFFSGRSDSGLSGYCRQPFLYEHIFQSCHLQ